MYGGSLPVSAAGTNHPESYAYASGINQHLCWKTPAERSGVAGRFCLSHPSQASATNLRTVEHQSWQEPQSLDYRSHSFPMDIRNASQVSVNPSHWPSEQTAQLQASPQSEQHRSSAQRPPVHDRSTGQSVDSSKSSWRQSLDHDQAVTTSFDSRSSEMTGAKKPQTVLIWDLDETLILFHSLLSGAYASHHSPEVLTRAVVTQWPQLCSKHSLSHCDQAGLVLRLL